MICRNIYIIEFSSYIIIFTKKHNDWILRELFNENIRKTGFKVVWEYNTIVILKLYLKTCTI